MCIRDRAGNVSELYPFIIDHIDKHSPVIDSVEWDKGWSQEKTVTVKAHDTESGLGPVSYTHLNGLNDILFPASAAASVNLPLVKSSLHSFSIRLASRSVCRFPS